MIEALFFVGPGTELCASFLTQNLSPYFWRFLLKGMQNTVKKYLQQRSLKEKYLKSLNSMAYI